MTELQAIILGLIQGITEFFPVSSSTHLKIAKLMLGIENTPVAFDLFCHLGTIFVLLFFFRRDIFQLLRFEQKKLWLFVIAGIPLVPFYFLFKPLRENASNPFFLGIFMLISSALLFLAGRLRLKQNPQPKRDALWIGSMQALALIPGISRSAATIGSARILGWEAKEAVRFSFLLSIPTILGGVFLECFKLSFGATPLIPCLTGLLSSFIAGLLIISPAIRFLEKGSLKPFAWYCLLVGSMITLFYG